MKKHVVALLLVAIAVPAAAQVHVRGYTRSDGTYVAPYERTAPNDTKLDNWSTKGNVNPYNGREGTQDPYPTTPTYHPYEPRPTTPEYGSSYKPPCFYNCTK